MPRWGERALEVARPLGDRPLTAAAPGRASRSPCAFADAIGEADAPSRRGGGA